MSTKKTATPLVAYHNDPGIKAKYLDRVRAHREADDLIKGQYWERGKGCAVGCTIHSSNHMLYEKELGIPVALARLEDTIFEGLANGDAQAWPERFLSAIKPGADLSRVQWQFLHWLLTDETITPGINHPFVKDAIAQCAAAIKPAMFGRDIDESAASAARSAARSAAYKRMSNKLIELMESVA